VAHLSVSQEKKKWHVILSEANGLNMTDLKMV